MKSVALHNLGCKVNAYELDAMQQMLTDRGYAIVPFEEKADIYIVNTCTVTNIADRKSRQMLHRAKKGNPDAVVVAIGCYVQTGLEQVEKDDAIDLAIGNNRKKDMVNLLEAFLREREEAAACKESVDKTLNRRAVEDLMEETAYEDLQVDHTAEHTRAYVKVQDGCNQFCSYCIIPFARGRVRSRRAEDILAEAERLAGAGYQEIVLTGIHLCSYGMDFWDHEGEEHKGRTPLEETYRRGYLLDLLRQLQKVEGVKRIRLGSLEPRIITEEFVSGIAALSKVCPHFHLSLQSGCDATLERMNRHYSAGEFAGGVEILRRYYRNPALTTDIIVGFPGESEEEFEETRGFLEEINFYEMHVFKYSIRQGTNAAKMKPQVPDQIKAKRSDLLLEMTARKSANYRSAFLGMETEVLLEEQMTIDGESYMTGHTREYIRVAVKTKEDWSNQMVHGKLCRFLREDLLLLEP